MKLMDYFLVYKKTIMCNIYVIIFLYVRKIRKTSVIYNVICYTHICFFFFLNSFFKSYLYIIIFLCIIKIRKSKIIYIRRLYIYNNFLKYNKNKKEQNNINNAFKERIYQFHLEFTIRLK